jgi:MarR family transcriptional regulator, organic hydroperoxide resistance regulator
MRGNATRRLPPELELFFLFKHAHHHLAMDVARRVEAAVGVPAAQVSALIHLDVMGPALVGELGDRLGLNSAGITGLVGRLERHGLVRRERSEHDRRAIRLHLTDQGRNTAARTRPIIAEYAHRLTADLTTAEIEVITRFLTGVLDAYPSTPRTIGRTPTRDGRHRT